MLIINADDLGMNEQTTDGIIACCDKRLITSATAMVFMRDTARAAELASSRDIGIGLHLNFTTPFDGPPIDGDLYNHHRKLIGVFLSWRYWRYLYNPSIRESIHYCFHSQYDEFLRVFKKHPTHIDGHHHIHLAANVIFGSVLPEGGKIRKIRDLDCRRSLLDSFCRGRMAGYLRSRFVTTDFLYSIEPMKDDNLTKKISTARSKNVELMVHPGQDDNYSYMNTDGYFKIINAASKGSYSDLNAN